MTAAADQCRLSQSEVYELHLSDDKTSSEMDGRRRITARLLRDRSVNFHLHDVPLYLAAVRNMICVSYDPKFGFL
ncbi:hypothetical protein BDN67DRAFT_971752 [Paxillus ammoniavirescens]|nr:hypothetical protein BDN67DRAFT_971752 [Paxillus ammoniavirescens]